MGGRPLVHNLAICQHSHGIKTIFTDVCGAAGKDVVPLFAVFYHLITYTFLREKL